MLRQRVITAVLLAGAFISALYYLPLPALAAVFGVVAALGCWEWSRLAGWERRFHRIEYVVVALLAMLALYFYCDLGTTPKRETVQPFFGLAGLWWSISLLWLRSYPGSAVIWGTVAMRSLMGLLVLVPAWLACVYLLSYAEGALLVFAMAAIVAAADIGAYFAGKSLGRHKLAPRVSPAKTWEGFWGGMLAVAVLAALVYHFVPAVQFGRIGLGGVLAVALSTALASVVGDLTESMVKRESGVKDSGSLLPGHGGFLDRLDSISAAAPVFALGLILADW